MKTNDGGAALQSYKGRMEMKKLFRVNYKEESGGVAASFDVIARDAGDAIKKAAKEAATEATPYKIKWWPCSVELISDKIIN